MKKLVLGIFFGASLTGMFMNSFNVKLQRELELKQVEMNRLGNEVAELKLSNNQLKVENAQLYWEMNNQWTSLGEFKVTYYWASEDSVWGDSIARPCKDKHKAIEGHTIAVDPTVIPYGTEVKIDGNIYVAEDCGSAVKGNVIDIYVNEPKMEKHYKEVFIKEK